MVYLGGTGGAGGGAGCLWLMTSLRSGSEFTCRVTHQGHVKMDFPGVPVGKNPPADAGDTGSTPGLGRFHM